MRVPQSIQWRIALAYTGLILVAMTAVTLFLVFDFQGQQVVDDQGRSVTSRVVQTTAVATAIVAALSVLLAVLIVRRSTRSLRSLTNAASYLARGDLDHRVPLGSVPETRELAEALNAMTANLKRILTDFSNEHDKLSAVLATMTDGVVLLDGEARISLVNPAAQDLLGLSAVRQEGERFIEMVRDHEINGLVSRCQETRNPQHVELRLAQGQRYLSVIAIPLALQREEGVLLTLHDLTQAHRVETTRREFVANVSHELRTPLASIKASAETLVGGASDDPVASREFLDRIVINVDRMSRLVEELLDLSRLESGEASLNLSSIDIYQPIREVVELYQERAQAQGVVLNVDEALQLPAAVADVARLQQVLSNLVENAVKFTPVGGRVSISARSRDGWLEVSVIDTGIGMAPEHLPHAFERFYKVDRSTNQEGTGLGLAIAKHIVQAHGGRIWAESRVGEGSIFTFTIPAGKAKAT